MTHPRGLSEDEATAWEKLAATVEPMLPNKRVEPATSRARVPAQNPIMKVARKPAVKPMPAAKLAPRLETPQPRPRRGSDTLDRTWDRKLKAGQINPNFTLDLHGHTLDSAYTRLMAGMAQARAMEARLVLIITGKSRPVDAADRGTSRGAIRAKLLDWLAAGEHGDAIAAVRKAHRKHGGDGALYLVLRRGV